MLLPAIFFSEPRRLTATFTSRYHGTRHCDTRQTPSVMDPQADSTARMAGTPAKANRNAADGDAESAHVSTPSADKAMLLSSPAAFSFARKHPPALSSKPRKATSLFRHPASEAGKKGNEYKNGASSPVTHEGTVSKSGADGDASSSGTAFAVAAEQDGGARTHGAASALSWDGRSSGSGGAGEGSGSGSGGVACFGSPVRPPRENASSFRFTPQRNLNGLFASPVPPPPPTPPPPVTGDDLPLGLGNSDRKETVPPGGPTDDLSMLRFPARMQQASETEPSAGELCCSWYIQQGYTYYISYHTSSRPLPGGCIGCMGCTLVKANLKRFIFSTRHGMNHLFISPVRPFLFCAVLLSCTAVALCEVLRIIRR